VHQLRFILSVVLITVCSIYPKLSRAQIPIYSTDQVAINGYDVVAYFLKEKALKGKLEYSYRWQGVDWLFSSEQHRYLFAKSPQSYQPMFGGFCGLGAAHGALVPSNPEAWTIHDGKLVFNQDQQVTETWRYNPDINLERGNLAYDQAVSRYKQRQLKTSAKASMKNTSSNGMEKQ
jgi:YHS domain-containing protein